MPPVITADDISGLFPGGGGLLLKGSGLADRLAADISSQTSTKPSPVSTRGVGGPPAVNTGIQNTPAPIPNLQPNPSSIPGTPQIPQTPVTTISSPQPFPGGPVESNSTSRPSIASGGGGPPLEEELKRRLRPQNRAF